MAASHSGAAPAASPHAEAAPAGAQEPVRSSLPSTAPPSRAEGTGTPTWSVIATRANGGVPVAASDLEPTTPGTTRWVIVAGKDAPDAVVETRAATSDHGAAWRVDDGLREVHYLVGAGDGAIAMVAVDELHDKATSRFEPPLGLAPARLDPGATYTTTARMTVTPLGKDTPVQQRGTAVRELTHRGVADVETATGRHTVQVVHVHFKADLELAKATTDTTLYVIPGHGVIASETRSEVTALIFTTRTERTLVRE